LFKRILLTAVLGAGLVLTVPMSAEADHKGGRDRDRKDWGIRTPGLWGHHQTGLYGDSYPFWHYRGYDKSPDLYWYPTGYGAGAPYLQGGLGYHPGGAVLTDVFGDDYYFAYGYRCNGYRDGYYYGSDGAPISYYGRPFYRRNADCENYHRRHGDWFGYSDCSRFEVEKGYCDDYDRH
jgi:hypothetical protein